MGRTSQHNVTITQTMVDRATPQAAAIAAKIEKQGDKIAATEEKIAKSSAQVAKAKVARLSPSKQVAIAMQLEEARGSSLQTNIALLGQEHAQLTLKMRALVRANQPIPAAMLKQAAASKKNADALRTQTAASGGLKDVLGKLPGPLGAVASSMVSWQGALAGAAVAIFALTDAQAKAGDEIGKTSRKLGISAETLQAYRKAADDSGSSSANLDKAIRALGKRSAEAAGGNKKLVEAFEALGVNVRDADGVLRDVEELLPEVADGMQQLGTDGERTARAMEIMGLGGNELLPMLAGGAAGLKEMTDKARELGGVINNETIAASEDYAQALGDLKFAVKGISNSLGNELVPALATAGKWWAKTLATAGRLIRSERDMAKVRQLVTEKGLKPQIKQIERLIAVRLKEEALLDLTKERRSVLFDEVVELQRLMTVRTVEQSKRRTAADKEEAREQEVIAAKAAREEEKRLAKRSSARQKARSKARSDRARDAAKAEANDARQFAIALKEQAKIEIEFERERAAMERERLRDKDRLRKQELRDVEDSLKAANALEAKAAKESMDIAEARAKRQSDLDAKVAAARQAEVEKAIGSFSTELEAFANKEKSFSEARQGLWKSLQAQIVAFTAKFVAAKATELIAAQFTATGKIAASTGEAVAEAQAAHAWIPFVGPALGAAAAAAMIALISLWDNFQFGGLVTGGRAGRDSVPALLTPGEIVLPVHLADQVRNLRGVTPTAPAAPADRDERRRTREPMMGAAPMVVQAIFESRLPPTRIQRARFARELTKDMEAGQRRRMRRGRI